MPVIFNLSKACSKCNAKILTTLLKMLVFPLFILRSHLRICQSTIG
jgi:hypothetical protein